jgi:hypothetical protein
MVKDLSLLEVATKSHGFVSYFLFAALGIVQATYFPSQNLANRMLTHGGSESAFYVYSHLPSRDGHGAVDNRHFATESS